MSARNRFSLTFGVLLPGVLSVATPLPAQQRTDAGSTAAAYTASYAGRTIDLAPHLGIGELSFFRPGLSDGWLYFRERTERGVFWRRLPISVLRSDGPLDASRATPVYPGVDLSTRFLSFPLRDHAGDAWYAVGDSANDEHTDLWRVDPGTGTTERITDEGTLRAPVISGGRILYTGRGGEREPYTSCLRMHDVRADRTVTVLCNDSLVSFRGRPVWRPDGEAFVVSLADEGRRGDLALFEVRRDSVVRVRWLRPADGTAAVPVAWPEPDRIRYLESGPNGVRNFRELSVATGRSTALTHFDEPLSWVTPGLIEVDGRALVLSEDRREDGTLDVTALDDRGNRLGTFTLPEGSAIELGDGAGAWWVSRSSIDATGEAFALRLRLSGDVARFDLEPMISPTAAARRSFASCRIEPVTFETFDGRTLHAFLRTPASPPPASERRLGIVYAFYGGDEEFDALASFWCDAGITSLSPAVRGSSTGDAGFEELTYGDRGGDEIVDVLFAARWLAQRMGVEPRQIGVYGVSRGGYNALQALTFDPSINGRGASFPFGFGIAQAGYSSLLTILGRTNTESPEIIATGDPTTPEGRAALRARSPVDQVHRLDAPVLLIHGTNDFRVQIEESRDFLAAARRAGKDVQLIELPGEGHGVAGLENRVRFYRAQLEFLDRVRRGLE